MRRLPYVIPLVLLCAGVAHGAAPQLSQLRADVARYRQVFQQERQRAPETRLFEAGLSAAFGRGIFANLGLASVTENGARQLRLVLATGCHTGGFSVGIGGRAGVLVSKGRLPMSDKQTRQTLAGAVVVGRDVTEGADYSRPSKGTYAMFGLFGSDGVDSRVNLSIPLLPRFKTLSRWRAERGLKAALKADEQLNRVEAAGRQWESGGSLGALARAARLVNSLGSLAADFEPAVP